MKIQRFWNLITNIGVDEAELGREVVKVRLLNQLIFLGFTISILVLISYIITNDTKMLIFSTSVNICIEFAGLWASYKKRHRLARYLAFLLFPTWVSINVILNAGGFGEANIFCAMAFCAFIMFEDEPKLQIPSVIYVTCLFVASKLYVINYLPAIDKTYNPYDEIITFPFILVILGLLTLLYQREMKRFQIQREKLILDLEQKNIALSEINEELEQFTYIASHDLKTPLRTVNSHLDLIAWHIKKEDFEAVKEDIVFAKQGAKQMYALINDILEYKQLSNQEELPSAIDLNDIVPKVVAQLEHFVKERKATIQLMPLPKMMMRRNDVFVLFQNLIENGIKYNQSDAPFVKVSYQEKEDKIIFRFEDNGIGIEEQYHEKIFQFFKRLHGSTTYEGTGIGLGLCKKIIQNYNGSISIEAVKTGGSAFVVCFPTVILA